MKHLEEAKLLVSKAKAHIVIHSAFFAGILLRRPMTFTESVPTLGVDALGRIYINPTYIHKRPVSEVVFGLAHECMHVMLQHAGRIGSRQHRKWNIAGDAVINDTLKHAQIGTFIQGVVDMPGSREETTDAVYAKLPDTPDGGGPGGIGEDLIPGDGQDDPANPRPLSEAEASAQAAAMKVEIAQAAQTAKMMGDMPAGLERFVEEILEVKTPWYEILERFMHNIARSDYTWSTPNRRHLASGMFLPSYRSESAMGTMVLQIDESGSIGHKELEQFAGHLNNILETCKPERLIVLHTDTEVGKVEEFSADSLPVQLRGYGGGGTDMGAGLEWVREHGIEPACFVTLTDGYTPWGTEPDYPVLWAITTQGINAPYGENLHIERED